MRKIAKCHVTHMDHRQGTTCLDVREHARENPDKYTKEFHDKLLNTNTHLCDACMLKLVIQGTVPMSELTN